MDNFHVKFIVVPMSFIGRRIDNFLLSYLKGISKNRLYCILRKGEVRVNKKRVKCIYRLNVGDVIRIPPIRGLKPTKVNVKYPEMIIKKLCGAFLYEDTNIIILNKPSGLSVHGGSRLLFNVIEGLRIIRPELSFLELVHRLDRGTSGALLLAKNYWTLMKLNEELRLNRVKKEYLALVSGQCNFHISIVAAPLIKTSFFSGFKNVKVDLIKGKYSLTHFMVRERFISSTLLNVRPITGRTHQIRVHAQHVGHPIALDKRYGDMYFNKKMKKIGLNRLFLHAFKLKFINPNDKKSIYIKAPIDPILLDCLSCLRYH